MTGPSAVLVTKESATHGRPFEDDIVPIDKTHSEIVKFEGPQDTVYYLVLHHLKRVGMDRSLNPLRSLITLNTPWPQIIILLTLLFGSIITMAILSSLDDTGNYTVHFAPDCPAISPD